MTSPTKTQVLTSLIALLCVVLLLLPLLLASHVPQACLPEREEDLKTKLLVACVANTTQETCTAILRDFNFSESK